MRRGAKASELPSGARQDTRKHTRHVLRPTREAVAGYLARELSWDEFARAYRSVIEERHRAGSAGFDEIAALARTSDVYLGCSCPTKQNPDVRRCHTWLALEIMAQMYPNLDVRFPEL